MNSVVEDKHFSGNLGLQCGDKYLDLSSPVVMGILNLTTDSFYSESRIENEKMLLKSAEKMILDGASILDLGGFSTRPGAQAVSEEDEIARIAPALKLLSKTFPDTLYSVDTFRSTVALRSIESGAHIVNDISGLQFDPSLSETLKNHRPGYILMHIKGSFETMHKQNMKDDPIAELISYFNEKLTELKQLGVQDVLLDPGFGFSKEISQNFEILKSLEQLKELNHPILIGVSRKSMIYKTLELLPEEALNGTTVLHTVALMKGASVLRAHDVKEAMEAIRLIQEMS